MKNRLLLLLALPLMATNCWGASITAAVAFGSKTSNGICCMGRGISKVIATDAPSPGAVKVTFEASPENDTLTMTFSLGELADNQLSQVAYFTNVSRTYAFDNVFPLNDAIFAALSLLPNAKILPTSFTSYKITGDQVKLSIKYAHNSYQAMGVNFGSKPYPAGGVVGKGIFKATKPGAASADAVTVNFQTSPDNDTLMLAFSLNELIHKQVRQVVNFADTLKSYMFDNAYSLAEPLFASLNLQPNAKILPTSPTVVKIVGDSVKLYIKYAHNSSVLAAVTFGAKQSSGGPGKGVANVMTTDVAPPAEAIKVSFHANPDNDTLTLVFSLYEMMSRQLHQVSYFTNPTGTYNFDDEFSLSGNVLAPLNLPPNSKISRKSPTALTINGDEVKLCIAYAHD